MTEQEMETKKKNLSLILKVVFMLLIGFFVAPFIYTAITGIIGLLIAGAICLPAFYLSTYVADVLANLRIKLIKAEAAKNPIETLQRDFAHRQEMLNNFKQSVINFDAATLTFQDKLDDFKVRFPNDTKKFMDILSKMKKLLSVRQMRYKEAAEEVDKYEDAIERAKAIWNMGQEAAKMNKAAGMSDDDMMNKIRVETAMDSITTSMTTAFAELETSLLEVKEEKELTKLGSGEDTLHVPEVIVQPEKVRNKK